MRTALYVFFLALMAVLAASFVVVFRDVEAQGGLIVITSPIQVTGAGAAVQLATSGTAQWIQVLAPSTNSATVNCGDVNVSTTRGILIAAGGGLMFPPIAPDTRQSVNQHYYSLANVYCYVANGDKVNFAWGN